MRLLESYSKSRVYYIFIFLYTTCILSTFFICKYCIHVITDPDRRNLFLSLTFASPARLVSTRSARLADSRFAESESAAVGFSPFLPRKRRRAQRGGKSAAHAKRVESRELSNAVDTQILIPTAIEEVTIA